MVKFKRSKSFTKKNIREVPQNTAIVYKLKNASGKNLYTGIAGRGRGQGRLLEHKEREKVPGTTKFQFAQVKNKQVGKRIEKQIIKKEYPRFNKQNK